MGSWKKIIYSESNASLSVVTASEGYVMNNLNVGGDLTAASYFGDGSNLTGILPTGLVSGSAQISYTGITNKPTGLVSGSAQISYTGITNKPTGLLSGSAQIRTQISGAFTTTSSSLASRSAYLEQLSATTFDITISVATDIYLDEYAWAGYKINSLSLRTDTGTATVTIKINTTAVTGLSSLTATTTSTQYTATAANTVSTGNYVILSITGTPTATRLYGSLRMKQS